MLQRGLFTIDYVKYYYGYADHSVRWNGWACPYFDFTTAKQILSDTADALEYEENPFTYNHDLASFVVDGEVIASTFYKGVALYPIGYQAWVWDDVPAVPHQLLIEDGGLTNDTVLTMYNLSTEDAVRLFTVKEYESLMALLRSKGLLTEGNRVSPDLISYPDLLIPVDIIEDYPQFFPPCE